LLADGYIARQVDHAAYQYRIYAPLLMRGQND